jgi:hypothetical protein
VAHNDFSIANGSRIVKRMKAEVVEDVKRGILPTTVQSFSELHDYVDANEYGGFCDGEVIEDERERDREVEFMDKCQTAIGNWLRAGGLKGVRRRKGAPAPNKFRYTAERPHVAVYIAKLETRHFSFEAVGINEDEAMELMEEAWKKHCREYKRPNNWDEFKGDVEASFYEVGTALRDGDIIIGGRK